MRADIREGGCAGGGGVGGCAVCEETCGAERGLNVAPRKAQRHELPTTDVELVELLHEIKQLLLKLGPERVQFVRNLKQQQQHI